MDQVWIFGYGSLIWRPAFDFEERRTATVEGFARRFWQGSTDHRGVPGAPGRVVTLVAEPGACLWGRAYRLRAQDPEEVLASLDVREQGGYRRSRVTVHLDGSREEPVEALIYQATRENPNYLGPATLGEIATQILRSSGPSGSNVDYLLSLAEFLREVGADEPHVFELADLVSSGS